MAKTYEVLQAQADVIKNETVQGANTADRVGQMFKDTLEFANEAKETADTANSVANEAKKVADTAAEDISALETDVTKIKQNVGELEENESLLILEYKGTDNATRMSVPHDKRKKGLKITYSAIEGWKTEQYVGINTDDASWGNISNWEIDGGGEKVTKEKVLAVLPIGTILQSQDGNIFGEDWQPTAEELVFKEGTTSTSSEIMGCSEFLRTGDTYFAWKSLFAGGGGFSSQDLSTWKEFQLADGKKPISLAYSEGKDKLFGVFVDTGSMVGSVAMLSGPLWAKFTKFPAGVTPFSVMAGDNTVVVLCVDTGNNSITAYESQIDGSVVTDWSEITFGVSTENASYLQYVYDKKNNEFVIIDNNDVYTKKDELSAPITKKATWNVAGANGIYRICLNEDKKEFVISEQDTAIYMARNKDVTSWEKVQLAGSDNLSGMQAIVSFGGMYYLCGNTTMAIDDFSMAPSVVNQETHNAVTDGTNFIGFNAENGKIYKGPLAYYVEGLKYGYKKIK